MCIGSDFASSAFTRFTCVCVEGHTRLPLEEETCFALSWRLQEGD